MAIDKHSFELFVHSVTELLKREQLIEEERYRRGEKYNMNLGVLVIPESEKILKEFCTHINRTQRPD